jgi:hypothetical protein
LRIKLQRLKNPARHVGVHWQAKPISDSRASILATYS